MPEEIEKKEIPIEQPKFEIPKIDAEVLCLIPENRKVELFSCSGNNSLKEINEIRRALKKKKIKLPPMGSEWSTVTIPRLGTVFVNASSRKSPSLRGKFNLELYCEFYVSGIPAFLEMCNRNNFAILPEEDGRIRAIRTAIPPSECIRRGLSPWGLWGCFGFPKEVASFLEEFKGKKIKARPIGIQRESPVGRIKIISASHAIEETIRQLKKGGQPQRIQAPRKKVISRTVQRFFRK